MVFVYLDAANGSIKRALSKECCPRIRTKDALALNSDGSRIYSIHLRNSWATVTLNRLDYNSATDVFSDFNFISWSRHYDTNYEEGKNQKYAIALSPDY